MNYDAHLDRYAARQRQLASQHEEHRQRARIALEEAFKEGDALVQDIIQPELSALLAALLKHHLPARITQMREVSELTPDSTFTVGIELREDHRTDLPRRGMVFTAVPHGKFFRIDLHTSLERSARPASAEMKFSETTREWAAAACARFLVGAFQA